MKKRQKSIKKTIGYILVLLGIAIPLSAFLMMSYRNFTGEKFYKVFLEEQKKISNTKRLELENSINAYNDSVSVDAYKKGNNSSIVDPFVAEEYKGSYPSNLDKNVPFAYLRIPKMDFYKPIYLDATWEHMDKGVAQVDGTSLPVGGKGKKSVIAGHRDWWGDTMFLYLHILEKGDKVYIERDSKVLEYEVDNFEVIDPSQWEKLLPENDKDILTLLTCEPFYPPRPYRLLVNCNRIVKDENNNNSNDIEIKELKEEKTDPEIKKVNMIIYFISLFGLISLGFVLYKFIIYLIR